MNPLAWQSLLFVPAHREKHLLSAIKLKPDAVILDLEDGVAFAEKPEGRASLAKHQDLLAKANIDCIIRVNADAAEARKDVAAIDFGKLAGIMVPKCVDRGNLNRVVSLLGAKAVPLIALIESPAALPQLTHIATAPGVCALMFGPEDYAVELGLSADAADLTLPAALLAAAAVAAKCLAIGIPGSLADFSDVKGFLANVRKARSLGFRAAAAIHPAQLDAIREGFKPTDAEIKKAKAIIAASGGKDKGARKIEGAMVDAPIIAQARRVLKQAGVS